MHLKHSALEQASDAKLKATEEAEKFKHAMHEMKLEHSSEVEDNLTPFVVVVVLVGLGGVALVLVSIMLLAYDAEWRRTASDYVDGMFPTRGMFVSMTIAPAIVGAFEVVFSLIGGVTAAMDTFYDASLRNVAVYACGNKLECVKRLPLKCEARRTYLYSMTLVIVCQMIAASVLLVFIRTVADANPGTAKIKEGGFVSKVLDYHISLFDECCASQGYTDQGVIGVCDDQGLPNQCVVPANLALLIDEDLLCTCFKNDLQTYNEQRTAMNESKLCDSFAQEKIALKLSSKIPGTDISVRSGVPEEIDYMPIVGYHKSPSYGCGVGLVRGFQWAVVQWILQTTEPYIVSVIIITTLQLFVLILGSVCVCSRRQEVEGDEEAAYLRQFNGSPAPPAPTRKLLKIRLKRLGSSPAKEASVAEPPVAPTALSTEPPALATEPPTEPPQLKKQDSLDGLI